MELTVPSLDSKNTTSDHASKGVTEQTYTDYSGIVAILQVMKPKSHNEDFSITILEPELPFIATEYDYSLSETFRAYMKPKHVIE